MTGYVEKNCSLAPINSSSKRTFSCGCTTLQISWEDARAILSRFRNCGHCVSAWDRPTLYCWFLVWSKTTMCIVYWGRLLLSLAKTSVSTVMPTYNSWHVNAPRSESRLHYHSHHWSHSSCFPEWAVLPHAGQWDYLGGTRLARRWEGTVEVSPSTSLECMFPLFASQVTFDHIFVNCYHFVKPLHFINNLLTVK